LNERLKDLQTALREAKTEAERKELERELKRLRDEQRELLADMDEVQQTMEKSDNQAQMAESRQQLEETRSQVQNAAEALEKGSVSQALSAGTRAQRQLQDLRDDFRKKNSNQFAEDVREMRREARDLAQTQEEISSKIEKETNQKQKTLAASEELKQLTSTFQEQKSGLTNLLQQMRQVSEQAEAPEPMLSRQLYETVRKTSQGNLEQNLSVSEEMLKRSFLSEAAQFSRRTQEEMNELKRGVEELRRACLGDEAETLRFAKSELDDLVNKLGQEIDQFAGGGARREQNGELMAFRGVGNVRESSDRRMARRGSRTPQAEQRQGESREGQSQGEGNRQESAQARTGQQGKQPASEDKMESRRLSRVSRATRQATNPAASSRDRGKANARAVMETATAVGVDLTRAGGRRINEVAVSMAGDGYGGPLTGGEFREWSERLGAGGGIARPA
jgi:hypothetical protein